MGIPGSRRALAVEDLDKANPALGETPGREHLLSKRTGHIVIQTVKPLRGFGLVIESNGLGNSRLHPKSQFVRLDPSAELGVARVFKRREPIEPAQQLLLDRSLGGPTGTPGFANGSGSAGSTLRITPEFSGPR